jgi:hypothetical protein
MSTILTDFDWLAPVPQIFTRSAGRCFWPGDRFARPLDPTFRIMRDLKALTQAMPPVLTPILRERFKPTRGPLVWPIPPALPLSMRRPWRAEELRHAAGKLLCADVALAAAMIERLLNTEEGMVTGLTHNFLLAMQMRRLRQLWEEMARREWEDDLLIIFQRALG